MKQALIPNCCLESKRKTNPSPINNSSLDKSECGWDGKKAFGQYVAQLGTGSPADAQGAREWELEGCGESGPGKPMPFSIENFI